MPNRNSGLDQLTSEIKLKAADFQANFEKRTSDPDNFLTMDELEYMFMGFLDSAKISSEKFLGSLLDNIDESQLIVKKKPNTGKRESTSTITDGQKDG